MLAHYTIICYPIVPNYKQRWVIGLSTFLLIYTAVHTVLKLLCQLKVDMCVLIRIDMEIRLYVIM